VKRLIGLALLSAAAAGCGVTAEAAAPFCRDPERVAVVAQSVPTAAYVPCLLEPPPGWRAAGFEAGPGGSSVALSSDRSDGPPVEVRLSPACDVTGASPDRPRAAGVRSYLRLQSITPDVAGTRYDVFRGGCVSSRFAFPRGPHIPLLEELEAAVELLPRRELRLQLQERLGVELDP
jgi:hypothetical protein